MDDVELDKLSDIKSRLVMFLVPTDDLDPYPEVEAVGIGTGGDQRPVIIVNLKEKPEWEIPFREFEGIEILWKVLGNAAAL